MPVALGSPTLDKLKAGEGTSGRSIINRAVLPPWVHRVSQVLPFQPQPHHSLVQTICDSAKEHHGPLPLDVWVGGPLEGCLEDLGCLLVHWKDS